MRVYFVLAFFLIGQLAYAQSKKIQKKIDEISSAYSIDSDTCVVYNDLIELAGVSEEKIHKDLPGFMLSLKDKYDYFYTDTASFFNDFSKVRSVAKLGGEVYSDKFIDLSIDNNSIEIEYTYCSWTFMLYSIERKSNPLFDALDLLTGVDLSGTDVGYQIFTIPVNVTYPIGDGFDESYHDLFGKTFLRAHERALDDIDNIKNDLSDYYQ